MEQLVMVVDMHHIVANVLDMVLDYCLGMEHMHHDFDRVDKTELENTAEHHKEEEILDSIPDKVARTAYTHYRWVLLVHNSYNHNCLHKSDSQVLDLLPREVVENQEEYMEPLAVCTVHKVMLDSHIHKWWHCYIRWLWDLLVF
jgi:hypothetical protein